MKRYQKLIKKGVNEPLSKIPFHGKVPIKRLSMLSKKLIPKSNTKTTQSGGQTVF